MAKIPQYVAFHEKINEYIREISSEDFFHSMPEVAIPHENFKKYLMQGDQASFFHLSGFNILKILEDKDLISTFAKKFLKEGTGPGTKVSNPHPFAKIIQEVISINQESLEKNHIGISEKHFIPFLINTVFPFLDPLFKEGNYQTFFEKIDIFYAWVSNESNKHLSVVVKTDDKIDFKFFEFGRDDYLALNNDIVKNIENLSIISLNKYRSDLEGLLFFHESGNEVSTEDEIFHISTKEVQYRGIITIYDKRAWRPFKIVKNMGRPSSYIDKFHNSVFIKTAQSHATLISQIIKSGILSKNKKSLFDIIKSESAWLSLNAEYKMIFLEKDRFSYLSPRILVKGYIAANNIRRKATLNPDGDINLEISILDVPSNFQIPKKLWQAIDIDNSLAIFYFLDSMYNYCEESISRASRVLTARGIWSFDEFKKAI